MGFSFRQRSVWLIVCLAISGASLEMKGAHGYTGKRPFIRNAIVSVRGAHNTDTETCTGRAHGAHT